MKRKQFIQTLLRGLSVVFVALLGGWIGKLLAVHLHSTQQVIHLPLSQLKESLFAGNGFFAFKKNRKPQVLSRRCPHLGCTLQENKVNDEIICPCHGSRFTREGIYLSGPAHKNMTSLPHSVHNKILSIRITQSP